MKHMKRMWVLAAALAAFLPRNAAAQEPCGWCVERLSLPSEHGAGQAEQGDHTEGEGWHPFQFWPGGCIVHGICVWVGRTDGPRELTDRFAAAVATGDHTEVLRLLSAAGEVAFVNRERSAIQVLACDGLTIFGHVPLDPEVLLRVGPEPAD